MNFRLTFLLVAILAIVGGSVWAVQSRRTPEEKEENPWLWKLGLEDMSRIAVTYQGDTVAYGRQGEQWVIEDSETTPVFQCRWGGITLTLSGPRPARILSPAVEEPALYGLAPPVSTVRVTDRSGQTVQFDLGNPTPDQQNQYIRLTDGSLSTIAKVWGDVVSRLVTEPPYPPPWLSVFDIPEVTELSVSDQGSIVDYGLPITECTIEDRQWHVVADDQEWLVDSDQWEPIVASLDAEEPLMLDEPQDLRAVGLYRPTQWLEIRPFRKDPIKIYLGELTSDGQRRYIQMSDSGEVATVDREWADMVVGLASDPPSGLTLEEAAQQAGAG